jgi:hypothetical protein
VCDINDITRCQPKLSLHGKSIQQRPLKTSNLTNELEKLIFMSLEYGQLHMQETHWVAPRTKGHGALEFYKFVNKILYL